MLESLATSVDGSDKVDGLPILMARNQSYAPPETELVDGDEIAFLPPLSGG